VQRSCPSTLTNLSDGLVQLSHLLPGDVRQHGLQADNAMLHMAATEVV